MRNLHYLNYRRRFLWTLECQVRVWLATLSRLQRTRKPCSIRVKVKVVKSLNYLSIIKTKMMRNFLDILLLFTAATYTNDRYASNINGNGNDCPIWPQEFRTDIKITGGPNSSADLLHSFIRGTFFYDSLNQQAATYLIYPPSIEAGEGGGDWQFRRQVLKYGRVYDIDLATGDCKSYPSNTRRLSHV
jgi:hypothetical protein